ncbi:serine palmitoyltransferase [Dongia mobilis]|uniref:Serine palmitoyltransferase n=1 Tax=Dongia mobilis TaxID=578943 RepID=A0A4R6WQJ4_9PROT|nr:aminotransferase class I/II-fold pyridoxal phosphate-dependent enzyme [Dongia mobilis]TDQ81464.1 serine palmitoyltransferase [Dongia mobilis]
MGLLDRFKAQRELHAQVKSCGADPFGVKMEKILSATEALIEGRPTILCGSNNYLGFTFDADCIEAAKETLDTCGTGTTGSRIANGSYHDHKALEQDLADFYGMKHCMVFTTGYQANLGAISTLAGPNDFLIIDADSHASIYDACKLGSATVIRFKHNDPADLDRRLGRLANEPGNKIVVVEGIYSMLGDHAPLKEFVAVTKKHGAYILVDEAHSMGVMGKTGQGVVEHDGVLDQVDFITGTFSKSMGAIGGFLVSNIEDFDILRVACRPYMFTASLPPATVASVRKSLAKLRANPGLMQKLWDNVDTLYEGARAAGFTVGAQKGPVVAVHINDPALAARAWRALLLNGVYVNLALPPATPSGTALLRCSVSAAHTKEQLQSVVDVLSGVGRELGILPTPAHAVAAE